MCSTVLQDIRSIASPCGSAHSIPCDLRTLTCLGIRTSQAQVAPDGTARRAKSCGGLGWDAEGGGARGLASACELGCRRHLYKDSSDVCPQSVGSLLVNRPLGNSCEAFLSLELLEGNDNRVVGPE